MLLEVIWLGSSAPQGSNASFACIFLADLGQLEFVLKVHKVNELHMYRMLFLLGSSNLGQSQVCYRVSARVSR